MLGLASGGDRSGRPGATSQPMKPAPRIGPGRAARSAAGGAGSSTGISSPRGTKRSGAASQHGA